MSTTLWSIDDVASYLQVPKTAIYKMTCRSSENPIPHVKLGGRLRFRQAAIDEWLDAWTVSPMRTLRQAQQHARSR